MGCTSHWLCRKLKIQFISVRIHVCTRQISKSKALCFFVSLLLITFLVAKVRGKGKTNAHVHKPSLIFSSPDIQTKIKINLEWLWQLGRARNHTGKVSRGPLISWHVPITNTSVDTWRFLWLLVLQTPKIPNFSHCPRLATESISAFGQWIICCRW